MKLNIKIIHPVDDSVIDIEVSAETILSDVYAQFIESGILSADFNYSSVNKTKDFKPLDNDKSMSENGIADGDTVVISRTIKHEVLRNIRLLNEHKELCQLEGNGVFSWSLLDNPAEPFVKEYLLSINVRTYSSPTETTDKCTVRMSIPAGYPEVSPYFTIVDPALFHPDIYADGRWNSGKFNPVFDGLVSMITRLIKGLQYKPGYVSFQSPCNTTAAEWYKENKDNPAMFPSDTTLLSDLDKINVINDQAGIAKMIKPRPGK